MSGKGGRFWGGSDSESDSDISISDEVDVKKDVKAMSRWVVESDSDSDDEVRVVKSTKARRYDGLDEAILKLRNRLKVKDWNTVIERYADLESALSKVQKAVIDNTLFPVQYLRCIVDIEDTANNVTKAETKAMSKTNSRSFNKMRQVIRKAVKQEPLAANIVEYRANPVAGSDDEDEESSEEEESSSEEESDEDSEVESGDEIDDGDSDDSDSDDDDDAAAAKPIKQEVNADTAAADDSDSDMWDNDSDSASSSDDEIGELKGRNKWTLKATEKLNEIKSKKPKKVAITDEEKAKKDTEELEVKLKKEEEALKKKEEEEKIDTVEKLVAKLVSVVAQRGKVRLSRNEQVTELGLLTGVSAIFGTSWQLRCLFQSVAMKLDYARDADASLPYNIWDSAFKDLTNVVSIIEADKNIFLSRFTADENAALVMGTLDHLSYEQELPEEAQRRASTGMKTIRVAGGLGSFVRRLAGDFAKGLQQIDSHGTEYVQRLVSEASMVELVARAQTYYERVQSPTTTASLALLRIEHTYYKRDEVSASLRTSQALLKQFGSSNLYHCAWQISNYVEAHDVIDVTKMNPASCGGKIEIAEFVNVNAQIKSLGKIVFQNGDDRSKTRAILCTIYYHSIHDRFLEARDLMLMSHLQDSIQHADIPTKVLFNRTMVQLGLAAFRLGHIREAHSCLSEICNSRERELLGQGVSRSYDKTATQETLEQRNQLPYHMHINLELMEACHLIAAMILEVPNMAAQELDVKRRTVSRYFRFYLDRYERQVFTGPPESSRDHILAASKYIEEGDWKKAVKLIIDLRVWSLWEGMDIDLVKERLVEEMKVSAVRTYMITYSSYYSSMSLEKLSKMFELPLNHIHSIVSKMVISYELKASMDQTNKSILLHREEPTSLQKIAMVFSEKLSTFVEMNERAVAYHRGDFKDDYRNNNSHSRNDYTGPRSIHRNRRNRRNNQNSNDDWHNRNYVGGDRHRK